MRATVSLIQEMQFRGETEKGHRILMDSSPQFGGRNEGPTPMELVLMALGACTGMDVITVLRKKQQDITGYEINVTGERASEHPRVFTRISVEHVIRGNVSREAAEKAVELSTEKYCSVLAMLRKTAEVSVSVKVE